MWMASAGYRYAIDPAMSMHGQREFMNEAQVMFSMSIPLWRSRNRAVRDEADARFHVAEQTEESTRRLLVARLKSILSQDRDARLRVRLHEEVLVPKVRQVTDATDAAYRSGKATLSDLTDAHRQWLDIHTRLHRARADLAIQKAALDALFGTEITLSQP
jgi:outer membrane protein TolC